MKKITALIICLIFALVCFVPAVAESTTVTPAPDYAALEARIAKLEQLVADLTERVAALEVQLQASIPTPEDTTAPVAPVDSILTIQKVKLSVKYSTLNLEVTVKNTSKSVTVDAYDLVAYGYDAYGEIVQYMTSDRVPLTSQETIKPGKTSPSGYAWQLYTMDSVKTFKVAVARYHTTDGQTVEIPEEQWLFVEGTR